MAPMYRNLYGYLLSYSGRYDEAVAQLQAGFALAPKNLYIVQNLARNYIASGRIAEAENLRESLRDALIARGEDAADVARRMAIEDATVAIARQPDQFDAISKPLGGDGLVIASIFPSHVDELFRFAEQQIDRNESGSDPVVLLRSGLFAELHRDPRYLRLLHKTGFDDVGNIR